MRTGAIFARGSCRALAWVLALGVAAVLSAGEAVAQDPAMVLVPDRLVFTPTSVTVDEGDAETFTIQLKTKMVESDQTVTDTTVAVSVHLSRAGATDGASFEVDSTATDALDAAAQVGEQVWTFDFSTETAAGTIDPDEGKTITVTAEEDGGVEDGRNVLIFMDDDWSFDHDGDGGTTPALTLSDGRLTIVENDNDETGVIVSKRTLTLSEGASDTYTVRLGSEPTDPVTVKVAVTKLVNASITAAPTSLVFTGGADGNWDTARTVTVTAASDSNTLNGSATITNKATSDDADYNNKSGNSVVVTEVDSVRTITLSTSADTVEEGEAITITATLSSSAADAPATLPGPVVIELTKKGTTPPNADFSEGDIRIAANSTAGSTTLMANHDTDADDETLTLVASVKSGSGIFNIPDNEITVTLMDDDTYTLTADKEEVAEGGKVTLTVKVSPAAAKETKVSIDLYRASGATVAPAEGQDADADGNAIIDEGETTAEFTLTTGKDPNDTDDEVVVVRAKVGSAVIGDEVTIMVLDTQAHPEFTFTLEPTFIGEADGEASMMLTAMTNKAVTADTTVKFAVEPDSTAMNPDDYTIMPESGMIAVMIEKGMTMGMTTVMVTPVADGMDEPNETIKLSGWIDADADPMDYEMLVGNYVNLTIIDGDSMTFTLSGPSDMNLVEGFEYDIEVMASTPVKADTTVMLMHGGGSTASADDYMVEDIMIMAGETMGRTKLMVKSDDMPDGGTDGGMAEKLVLYGMVGNMRTNELSFYIWDLAVPALPVIAQLLLAALMAVGGYRRYRRR